MQVTRWLQASPATAERFVTKRIHVWRDDYEAASGREDPLQLCESLERIGHMFDHMAQGDGVECILREVLLQQSARMDFDVLVATGSRDGCLVEVCSSRLPAQLSHASKEITGAAADVEQSPRRQMRKIAGVGAERFTSPDHDGFG